VERTPLACCFRRPAENFVTAYKEIEWSSNEKSSHTLGEPFGRRPNGARQRRALPRVANSHRVSKLKII
jgi:hypothetical protein